MPTTFDFINGVQEYTTAVNRAFWQDIINLISRKPAQLLSFEDIRTRLRLREESYRGLQNIELERIVGSVGRYTDFTRTFLPRNKVNRDRWTRIYAETVSGMGLPPIEVYQVGESYFVRDGNHRVSVARSLDSKHIQAYVTELSVPDGIAGLLISRQMVAAEAYIAFLDEIGLRLTHPEHESLMLSEPSRYPELLGHIRLHQEALNCETCDGDMTLEQAAGHWYDQVYLPAIEMMRAYDVLGRERGRTEADFYLWMVDHLQELSMEYTGAPSDFNPAMASWMGKHRLPLPQEFGYLANAV
jgi:hypothetical protein